MTDPRDYVPPEVIVRAVVDAPPVLTLDECPSPPFTRDALLHVAECESCQASLDASALLLQGYDAALAYVPPEGLVTRVLTGSARRRYRVRLLDDGAVVRTSHPSLRKRAAALLAAWALSPAVLAAAVVVHAALAVAVSGITMYSTGTPRQSQNERVDYATLAMYRAALPDEADRRSAERRALALSVEQEMPVASVMNGLPSVDQERLDSTAATLRRSPGARVLVGAQRTREALSAAEVIGRYLIGHGVSRSQVKIVAGGAGIGRVTVSLDTASVEGR